jgi:hypothetical protein
MIKGEAASVNAMKANSDEWRYNSIRSHSPHWMEVTVQPHATAA